MENLNIYLGIINSILSITVIVIGIIVRKDYNEIKEILKSEYNVDINNKQKESFTKKSANSGKYGNSIIGNNNSVGKRGMRDDK